MSISKYSDFNIDFVGEFTMQQMEGGLDISPVISSPDSGCSQQNGMPKITSVWHLGGSESDDISCIGVEDISEAKKRRLITQVCQKIKVEKEDDGGWSDKRMVITVTPSGDSYGQYQQRAEHLNHHQVQVDMASAAGKREVIPVRKVVVPGKQVVVPGKGVVLPGKQVVVPGKRVVVPVKGEVLPGKQVVVPGKGVVLPGKQVVVLGKQVVVPGKRSASCAAPSNMVMMTRTITLEKGQIVEHNNQTICPINGRTEIPTNIAVCRVTRLSQPTYQTSQLPANIYLQKSQPTHPTSQLPASIGLPKRQIDGKRIMSLNLSIHKKNG